MQFKQILFVFLCDLSVVMTVGAEEYRVAIPSSFETEVFFRRIHGDQPQASQYSHTQVQFQDFQNYRIVSRNATTIKPEFLQDGKNLGCGERETVVIDGTALSVDRETADFFQGVVPLNPETLTAMIDERCRDEPWTVSFSTDYEKRADIYRIEKLGSIIGLKDFLNQNRTAFSIEKKSILKSSDDSLEANLPVNGDLHRLVLQKWQSGWRVSELNSKYRNPPLTMKHLTVAKGDSLESEMQATATSNSPEMEINVRMTNIQFGSSTPVVLTRPIANGTPVSLDGTPQIKAVWKDGKVVRVYEGGTVDDLDSATFRTTSGSYGIVKTVLITLGFACIGVALMWMRSSRAMLNHDNM
jgi:hypothetical protein